MLNALLLKKSQRLFLILQDNILLGLNFNDKRPHLKCEPISPCIRQCCLNEQDVCVGCGRSMSEIIQWSKLKTTEKQKVVELAQVRRDKMRFIL